MTRPRNRGLLGTVKDGGDRTPGGGCIPIGPHYHPQVARALAKLAESKPDPITYARERARILEEKP